MKKTVIPVIGLAALMLAGVTRFEAQADEVEGPPFLYVGSSPHGATVSPRRVGLVNSPLTVPKGQLYPVKLALAVQPTAESASAAAASVATASSLAATANQPSTAGQVRAGKHAPFTIFDGAGDHLAEMVLAFGERVVPPPEVSDLVHVEELHARDASDKYHWTFWKYKNDADRPIFGTDFLFTYHYPTFGECPKGFRGGEVIVGFGLTIPLNNFKPLGRLFTLR